VVNGVAWLLPTGGSATVGHAASRGGRRGGGPGPDVGEKILSGHGKKGISS
jgi:hypothetical protein